MNLSFIEFHSTSLFARGLLLLSLIALTSSSGRGDDPYQAARDRLVRERVESAGVKDPRVLQSIRSTPRHEFVPNKLQDRAYFDMALPIGESQTISSPFIVALMTEALDPKPTDKVLEIGTGSGYQAAVLSPLVKEVYSIEIVRDLGERAAEVLESLDYKNVSTRVGDGFLGWPEAAPFDKIIVTCSPESVPKPLVEQLREGGVMIIPVGERYQQTLYLMTKKDGELLRQPLRPTLFVPMTGEAEDNRQLLPDAANPKVVNGDFETAASGDAANIPDYVPGCITVAKSAESPMMGRLFRVRHSCDSVTRHQGSALICCRDFRLMDERCLRFASVAKQEPAKFVGDRKGMQCR